MEFKQIYNKASHQLYNWSEFDGKMKSFDISEGLLWMDEGTCFTTNDNAQKQIISRLGLTGTYRDFIEKDTGEQDFEFMQTAIDNKMEKLNARPLVRKRRVIFDTDSMEAKALMTIKYKRMSNHNVLSMLMEKYGDEIDTRHSYIDDNRMMITYNQIEKAAMKVGDTIGFGIRAWNSETGVTGLGCGSSFIRLVCSNGATMRTLNFMKKLAHIYSNIQELFTNALANVLQPDHIIGILNHAINLPGFSEIDKIPEKLSKYRIPEIHHEGIMKAHFEEPLGVKDGRINGYGIHAAITRYNSNIYPKTDYYDPNQSQRLMDLAFPFLQM